MLSDVVISENVGKLIDYFLLIAFLFSPCACKLFVFSFQMGNVGEDMGVKFWV